MKLPYRYKNIRRKDFLWLIKVADKENIKRLNDVPEGAGPFEMPRNYENYFRLYYNLIIEQFKKYKDGEETRTNLKFRWADNKINIYEYAIINMYTRQHIDGELNGKLRAYKDIYKLPENDLRIYGIFLNIALNKIPSFSNKVVYHQMTRISEDDIEDKLNEFKNFLNKPYSFPYFLSTYSDKCHPSDYLFLEIHTKRYSKGKLIKRISAIDNEEEVLFKFNSTFRVINVDFSNKTVILDENL